MLPLQYFLNLKVRYLAEVVVPGPHCDKRLRRGQTNAFLRLAAKTPAGLPRADGYRDDQLLRMMAEDMPGGRHHGRSGSQTIVDQHDSTAAKVRRWETTPIQFLPAFHLARFVGDHSLHLLSGNPQIVDQLGIQNPGIARQRTHGEFRLPGDAEFTNHNHIQRRAQGLRYGGANFDAAARQREDNGIRPEFPGSEFQSQKPARFGSILKW